MVTVDPFAPTVLKRFWLRVDSAAANACWPWRGRLNLGGYGQFTFSGKKIGAHRYALASKQRSFPASDVLALHECDNPWCCNPTHLRWGSSRDNAQDATHRGRIPHWPPNNRGPNNGNSRLTEQQAVEALESCEIAQVFADKFAVSVSTIYMLRAGYTWKHLPRRLAHV